MNRYFGFLVLILLVPVAGCKDENKQAYANVSGTVTFNGKPIEKGTIMFSVPGNAPSTADIVDGKYAGQAAVGSNKVQVSMKKKGKAVTLPKEAERMRKGYMNKLENEGGAPAEAFDPSLVEAIPAEWNTDSKQTRVVEAGGDNKFDFDIKGK